MNWFVTWVSTGAAFALASCVGIILLGLGIVAVDDAYQERRLDKLVRNVLAFIGGVTLLLLSAHWLGAKL